MKSLEGNVQHKGGEGSEMGKFMPGKDDLII